MNTRIHICCRTAGRAKAVRGPVLPPCNSDRTGEWRSANEIGRWNCLEAGWVAAVCPAAGTPQKSADRTECVPCRNLTQGKLRGQERRDDEVYFAKVHAETLVRGSEVTGTPLR